MTREMITIRQTAKSDKELILETFRTYWSGDFIVTRGKIHRPDNLLGFIAQEGKTRKGLLTYKITGREIEIISLNSFYERQGIGSALVGELITEAKRRGLRRIYVITTNDNLLAQNFYKRRGFRVARLYPNAMQVARKLKPTIPLVAENGLPIRDEVELEINLA